MHVVVEVFGIHGDWSSSSSSLVTSSSDEEKKMNRKVNQGRGRKYIADVVQMYVNIVSPPYFKRRGGKQQETRCVLPPPCPMDFGQAQTPFSIPQGVGVINEEIAREALHNFVAEHCCYRKGPAQNMVFTNLRLSNILHYLVETYTESRKVYWKSTVFSRGESISHPSFGQAPLPWDIDVGVYQPFNDTNRAVEVPFTSSVKKCWYCKGKGRVKCRRCHGRRVEHCTSCNGTGRGLNDDRCMQCDGTGHRGCLKCGGRGIYSCRVCTGTKRLKWYIEMKSKTETMKESYLSENVGVPNELLTKVASLRVYEDEQLLVRPLQNFPDPVINQKSYEMLTRILTAYPEKRYNRQRQSVSIVPVSEVNWEWNDQMGSFYVYGMDNKVFFPDYPQKCCCSLF